mmetsp:Transcript_15173/g.44911  ORF Transcript_15173/g.44911 Transcript_15173/m.44911 type:complete len:236 (+) Transcript_15173:1233-1940(+)
MVRFCEASCSMRHATSKAVAESRPDVGSSRKMTSGRFTTSTAMESRFNSPPESPPLLGWRPTNMSSSEVSWSMCKIMSTRREDSFLRSSGGVELGSSRRNATANSTVSRTVSKSKWAFSWRTYAWLQRPAIVSPASHRRPLTNTSPSTRPDRLDFLPAITSSMVVLPAPDGPMIASISPGSAMPVSPCSICTSATSPGRRGARGGFWCAGGGAPVGEEGPCLASRSSTVLVVKWA